jgi:serine/threonine protein phosphatase PrpC
MGCHWSDSYKKNNKEKDKFVRQESYLAKPDRSKNTQIFKHGSLSVAVSAMRGWREYMEDCNAIETDPDGKLPLLVAVYDGHNGVSVASFCGENLLTSIKQHDAFSTGDYEKCFQDVFIKTDDSLRDMNTPSGSTAIIAMVTEEQLIVANCGDSRCILSRRDGMVLHHVMSTDHKPNVKGERRRILKAGGLLDESDPACHRVVSRTTLMAMATSRALGDFDFKTSANLPPEQQMVTCYPDIIVQQRTSSDRFLILASDGVWDVFSNIELVTTLDELVSEGVDNIGKLTEHVLEKSFFRGSSDNMTIIIVDLRTEEMKAEDSKKRTTTPEKLSETR